MRKILLRQLTSLDIDAFMLWGGDPEVTRPLFWDHYTDKYYARKFLCKVAENHPWFKAISLNGEVIGAITLD